jgi:gas vesicle protein
MFTSVARQPSSNGAIAAGFVIGCAAGIICGSLLGVLYAPHSGKITRRKLGRKLDDARDQADESLADLKSRRAGGAA